MKDNPLKQEPTNKKTQPNPYLGAQRAGHETERRRKPTPKPVPPPIPNKIPCPFDYKASWWREYSRWLRRQKAWKCDECHITVKYNISNRGMLQTHHIYGVKHNTIKDLQVLCIGCHAEKPGENHQKLTEERTYERFMEIHGKEWQKKNKTFSEVYLLKKTFKPPVILYTPEGSKTVTVERVLRYNIQPKGGEVIKKIDVMFALSKASLLKVKSGITIETSIKAQGNRTAEKRADRPKVQGQVDASANQKRVRCVMLTGHILRGTQRAITCYHIILEIAGEIVLVYRHGLRSFSVEAPSEIRATL